jgi:transcriptional regulator with XRE-family HTH domain
MEGVRLGRQLRALRIRKRRRQEDVGREAGLSRSKVSRIERGLLGSISVGDLERVADALGATIDVRLRWQGEGLDRLLDEAHSRLVDVVVTFLRAAGWDVVIEASYSFWGERGSIDILAYHRATGIVLVIEVKSIVPDSQALLHALDRKTRLARKIAAERGWRVTHVARLLVIGASDTSRRRVARLAATYDTAFPDRGSAVRKWLRNPSGAISGLLFVAPAQGMRTNDAATAHQRVRLAPTRLPRKVCAK